MWYPHVMNSIDAIAASGMRLAGASLAAHASNTANLLSDGYKARKVSGETLVGGGVDVVVRRDETPGPTGYDSESGASREFSNVNLEDQMIGARLSTFMYAANAAVIYAADAAAGTLLNRMA